MYVYNGCLTVGLHIIIWQKWRERATAGERREAENTRESSFSLLPQIHYASTKNKTPTNKNLTYVVNGTKTHT